MNPDTLLLRQVSPSWIMYPLESIRGDILELERETQGLIAGIVGGQWECT